MYIQESGDIILENELSVARGTKKAELVLKNAGIINVFTESIEQADVAICDGKIVGIGIYEGEQEIDCLGKYVAPGFIDGHIHLESSMLKPVEFAKAVLPHGTTAVITDPHEITNVCGILGMEYMLKASEGLPLDVYFMVPSCVPSTSFDESGCVLKANDMESLYHYDRVLGLAEVMDYVGTIRGDTDVLDKLTQARKRRKVIDGHAPGLKGQEACAYVTAGIGSDHECIDFAEAKEKFSLGQWIMIREGSAAKNFEALFDLFQAPYYQRSMLVTDDKHPFDLLHQGHIDDIIRRAIKKGANPCIAIKMATLNPATYFGLKENGAIAPGFNADIIILSDLHEIKVEKVIKNGRVVVDDGNTITIEEPYVNGEMSTQIYHSVHCREVQPKNFSINLDKETQQHQIRIIQLIKGEILTKEVLHPIENDISELTVKDDILKIAAIERHHNTNHIGLGFVKGYGLKKGAIASSVSHDSHNIIVVGTNDTDMAAAVNCIRDMQGGWAIALDGKIIANLTLSIGGLMSDLEASTLAEKINELQNIARDFGVLEGIDPFMTLAFVSLPVIPELRLLTTGLFDVRRQSLVPILCQADELD